MKKLFTLLTACCISICAGQVPDICAGVSGSDEPEVINCTKSSPQWSYYSNFNNHIPTVTTAEKIIHVNIVVWQNDNNSPAVNWQNTPAHLARLNAIMNRVNDDYINFNAGPSDPVTGVTEIPNLDKRVQIKLENIYFIENSGEASDNSMSGKTSALLTLHPEVKNHINIHIVPLSHPVAQGESSGQYSRDQYIFTGDDTHNKGYGCQPLCNQTVCVSCPISMACDNGDCYRDYQFAHHLAHEIGHNIGLYHVYYNIKGGYEPCSIISSEYMSDVFPQNAPYCNPPNPNGSTPKAGCDVCLQNMANTKPLSPPANYDGDPFYSNQDGWTNNLMNGNDGNYLTPMQAGRAHRATSLYNVGNVCTGFSETPKEITQNETWDFPMQLYRSLVVKTGVTLTITCTLRMPEQGTILVEPGGKLILNGGHITKRALDPYWGGIFIEGNDQLPQTYSNQGALFILNGGTISYARHAITNAKYGTNGEWFDWGTSGGIIHAVNAVFENNHRDVQLVGYHNYVGNIEINYQARFFNCTFIRNDKYDISTMDPHVTISDVVGVRFEGCTFENTRSAIPSINSKSAIFSIGAAYDVSNCTLGGTAYVSNVSVGGYYKATEAKDMCRGDKTIKILNSTFRNNKNAIYLNNTGNAKVADNNILVTASGPIRPNHGVYFDESFNYLFHGNDLEVIGTGDAIGAIFHHNGTYMNEVYGNKLDGFTVGFEAIGINRNANNDEAGLCFKCNEFGNTTNNTRDIWVVDEQDIPDAAYPNGEYGVAAHQGSNKTLPNTLANNFFSPGITSPESNFWNDEQKVPIYYYGTGTRVEPLNRFNVSLNSFPISVNATHCPVKPAVRSGGASGSLSDLASADLAYASDRTLLQNLIDDGNSLALEAEILAATNQEHQNLYIEMMDMSPYVSIENLLNIINLDGFPELALRNIMVANPQSSREGEVWEALVDRVPALSQLTLDDIQNETQTITSYDLMYARITQDNIERHLALKDLLYFYEGDSAENADITAMENLFAGRNEAEYRYMLLENQIAKGAYSTAQTTLNNMSSIGLDGFELEQHNDLITYYTLVVNALSTGEPRLDDLDAGDISTLQTLAQNGLGISRTKARNLLERNGEDNSYEEPLYLPGESYKTQPVQARPAIPQTGFRLFPNPATTSFSVQWNWFEDGIDQAFTIDVTDLTGKVVYTKKMEDYKRNNLLISTENWVAGAYLVKLISGDKELYANKVIVKP